MQVTTVKSAGEIRKAVKAIFGADRARVTKNGEVHVKDTMPGSNEFGWYLLGHTGTGYIDEKLWYPDGSLVKSLRKA